MPTKITLDQIKSQLPSFIQIIPESYRGIRYKAEFLDLDYQEKFWANVGSVIKLQHGCKKRADKRRQTATKGRERGRITLQKVIAKLPPYLTITPESYKGVREKASFTDTEFNETFEALVCNVLRHGKGYCPSRSKREFPKTVTLTPDEIQLKINSIYGESKVVLLPETYVNTNTVAKFLIDNTAKTLALTSVLSGRLFHRRQLERWKAAVNARDNFSCRKCGHSTKICVHHILPWVSAIEDRFNINNGLTLCSDCHNSYHGAFKGSETPENLCSFFGFDLDAIKAKLAEPKKIPPV